MAAPARASRKSTGRQAAAGSFVPPRPATARVVEVSADELERLRGELERTAAAGGAGRWNPDPDDVQRSVLRLVLTLVEFLRRLMERQALRRMDEGTLEGAELERVGLALMKLEQTVHDLARRFKIRPDELNLDLGPVGRLL